MGNKAMKDFIDDTSRCKTQSDKSEGDEEKEIEDLFQAEVDEAEQKAQKKKKKKEKKKEKKKILQSQIIPREEAKKKTLHSSKSDLNLRKKIKSNKDENKIEISDNFDINAIKNEDDLNVPNFTNNDVVDINGDANFDDINAPMNKNEEKSDFAQQNKVNQNYQTMNNQNNNNNQRVISHEIYEQVNQKDLHTINVCMKKCSERFNMGLTEFKENNYGKSYELLTKTKNSYNQLLNIITTKESELPKPFVRTLRVKIKEKIEKIDNLNKTIYPLAYQQKYSLQKHFDNFLANKKVSPMTRSTLPTNNTVKSNINNNMVKNPYPKISSNPPSQQAQQEQKKKNIHDREDDEMLSKIESEIMSSNPGVKFSDIVGMKELKQIIYEIIIMPTVRPDLFTGLRRPQRGLLLFGPPGTGKTMIAKAVASECSSTFFNISASSLTSKWVGESEKTVRALFKLAYQKQPSIIFIDEIDSILSKRSDNDNEAAKRLKTEFLIQFDGLGSNSDAKLLVITATNRPMDLDDALLRRLPKRVYCGPLDVDGRFDFVKKLIKTIDYKISDDEIKDIAKKTENYSNSDLKELCREAAYEPVRELSTEEVKTVKKLRPITKKDFDKALNKIRATISDSCVKELMDWNKQFGTMA